MGSGLLQTVTEMASACSRHVTRAARKLRRQGPALSRMSTAVARPFLSRRQSSKKRIADRKTRSHDGEVKEEEEEEGVWRRSILMGEKCQPLDFSGVIYYDGDGRKLSEVPTPRTPLRSPLPSFPHPVTVGYDTKKDDI
ncbi:uncharacterized protein LOC103701930 [Phoenix dactylifera]|uniref:Uncharacterized protein LOC103701930 n=1 Tax=Phoenix dactylifera TaxID=42345 RepID=A0A8B7BNT8_PHODC|nr:uncharacterized protein LOC103701930 [Phoenix dactylifera]